MSTTKRPPRSKEWREKISQNMKRLHAEGKAKIAVPKPLIPRFWEKVQKGENCWNWIGAVMRERGGYGAFNVGNHKVQYAHRFSWELHNGPIPEGLFVCHHCDNPKCVRPDHLFLGDHWDNMKDATLKARMGPDFGPKPLRKYTEEQVVSVMNDPRKGERSFATVKAKELGIPRHVVVRFKTGGHVS